jgi:hypothetical protein
MKISSDSIRTPPMTCVIIAKRFHGKLGIRTASAARNKLPKLLMTDAPK